MASSLVLPLVALLLGSRSAAPATQPTQSTTAVSSQPNFWRDLPAAQVRRLGKPRLPASRYRVLALDVAAVKNALASTQTGASPALLLPLPDGTYQSFGMRATSVLAPELAAKYPELLTYAGQATPADQVRLEITPTGLHAQLIHQGHTFLIEPYRAGDTQHYICFDKASLPAGSKQGFEVPGGPRGNCHGQ